MEASLCFIINIIFTSNFSQATSASGLIYYHDTCTFAFDDVNHCFVQDLATLNTLLFIPAIKNTAFVFNKVKSTQKIVHN